MWGDLNETEGISTRRENSIVWIYCTKHEYENCDKTDIFSTFALIIPERVRCIHDDNSDCTDVARTSLYIWLILMKNHQENTSPFFRDIIETEKHFDWKFNWNTNLVVMHYYAKKQETPGWWLERSIMQLEPLLVVCCFIQRSDEAWPLGRREIWNEKSRKQRKIFKCHADKLRPHKTIRALVFAKNIQRAIQQKISVCGFEF